MSQRVLIRQRDEVHCSAVSPEYKQGRGSNTLLLTTSRGQAHSVFIRTSNSRSHPISSSLCVLFAARYTKETSVRGVPLRKLKQRSTRLCLAGCSLPVHRALPDLADVVSSFHRMRFIPVHQAMLGHIQATLEVRRDAYVLSHAQEHPLSLKSHYSAAASLHQLNQRKLTAWYPAHKLSGSQITDAP